MSLPAASPKLLQPSSSERKAGRGGELLAGWKTTGAGWWDLVTRRGGQRALRERIEGLGAREAALRELADAVELRFVAVGTALQDQAGLSGELVRKSASRLGNGNTGEPCDPLRRTIALVQRMLAFAAESGAATEQLLGRMEDYRVQMGRLLAEERRVERILAPLRIIQTLFRIESATLPLDVQIAFAALSSEIPEFEGRVRDAFARHADTLTAACRSIQDMADRLRDSAATRAGDISARGESIGKVLGVIEQELVSVRACDARLHEILQTVERTTGSMVVSLQYQDITRQKMEHVRHGLSELMQRAAAAPRLADDDLPYLHHACRLESLQLQGASEDLERAMSAVSSGAREILEALRHLETECFSRAELAAARDAAELRVRSLQRALDEAMALVPSAWAGAGQVMALIQSFGGAVSSVAETAREMAESMRMIALNAQVQAAQAGDAGAGLLILSERTYLISEEIKLITRSIGAEFERADRLLAEVTAEGSSLTDRAQAVRDEFARGAAEAGSDLETYRGATAQLTNDVASALEAIEQRSAAMLESASFDEQFCAPLGALRGDLDDIADTIESFAQFRRARTTSAGTLQTSARRYTMDSERRVHAAALAAADAGEPQASRVPELAGATSEPVADNVELF